MKQSSWIAILLKILFVVVIFIGIHTQKYFVDVIETINLSKLTSFNQFSFNNILPSVNLVDLSNDKISLLAQQTYQTDLNLPTVSTLNDNLKTDEFINNGKRIYLYNTHQYETYAGGESVIDATHELASQLRTMGYEVDVETADFQAYMIANDLERGAYYSVSKIFLEDRLIESGPYDLVIDVHRDAANKNITTHYYNDKTYAKLMFVIGTLSGNSETTESLSRILMNNLETMVPGVTRNVFYRQAYFNQQIASNVVLVEVGAQYNIYDEVKNSINILAQAIDQYLQNEIK